MRCNMLESFCFEDGVYKLSEADDVRYVIEQQIDKNARPDDVLILFDIDLTLIGYSGDVLKSSAISLYKKEIKNAVSDLSILKNKFGEVFAFNALLASLVCESDFELVDYKWPVVISGWLNRGYKVIGFTSCLGGCIGSKQNFKEYRAKKLKEFGINFYSGFDTYNCVYKGMLIAETESKGAVLNKFLKEAYKNRKYPKQIFFVDDTLSNLESCREALKKYDGVEYYPIHFVNLEKLKSDVANLDSREKAKNKFMDFLKNVKEIAKKCNPDNSLIKKQ